LRLDEILEEHISEDDEEEDERGYRPVTRLRTGLWGETISPGD
jgi:hypothetical protein